MRQRFVHQLVLSLESILLAGAVFYLAMFVYVSLSRMAYPYELEWMEGGSVDHVRRVLTGLPLYVEPSMEFTPFIYQPLFFYLSALFSLLLGEGFLPLRLLSFLSTIGCFFILYLFARNETGRKLPGIIAAGIFAGAFSISGAWYDLARPDMLFLFFLLAGVYLLRFKHGWKMSVTAAVLMALSFYSKQNALPFAALTAVYAVLKFKGADRLVYPLSLLCLIALWICLFQIGSDGWYGYYIFDLPGQHVIHYDSLAAVVRDDFLLHMALFISLAGIFLLYHVWKKRNLDSVFHIIFFGGLFALSLAARMHSGGYLNALIPAYAAIAVYGAMALSLLFSCIENDYMISGQIGTSGVRQAFYLVRALVFAGLFLWAYIWQFKAQHYDAAAQIPDRADLLAGDVFIDQLKNIDGDVYLPYHGFLPAKAGKQSYAQGMALEDVFRGTDEARRDALKNEIREAIENRRFSAIVLDGEWRFMDEINANYVPVTIEYQGDAFIPVTGMSTRPSFIYLPREGTDG